MFFTKTNFELWQFYFDPSYSQTWDHACDDAELIHPRDYHQVSLAAWFVSQLSPPKTIREVLVVFCYHAELLYGLIHDECRFLQVCGRLTSKTLWYTDISRWVLNIGLTLHPIASIWRSGLQLELRLTVQWGSDPFTFRRSEPFAASSNIPWTKKQTDG